ncbi:hypothetical protein Rhal01_00078 [Rubritalea halochordaticola]|uniref:L,D-TPase catalytic domain-containing protein n=1 Tax=Rubritalea halochordaticola TaxID=714537 RepID=A0ABP9UYK8_9BACT
MNKHRIRTLLIKSLLLGSVVSLATSCGPGAAPTPNPNQVKPIKAVYVNPFKPGTYQHFTALPEYPKTYKVYKNGDVLAATNETNSKVIIDLSLQRAKLYNGKQLAMDYPISSGNSKFPTRTGNFSVLEKIPAEKRSNLYGKIYDAEGNVVNSNANKAVDPIPEGGRFEGALMSNWMRLTWDGIGMHRGRVPRYPASHGCIRTPGSVVKIVYNKVKIGTPVTVQP